MNSPYLNLPKRSEVEVRAEERERFIKNQLEGLHDLPMWMLQREEALLRGGAEVVELINHICAGAGIK